MDNRAIAFYEGIATMYSSARLSPLALLLTLAMGFLLCALPKRMATVPILVVMLSITVVQRVEFLGMNFGMMRIMILFGWVRVLLRRETSTYRKTTLDLAVVILAIAQVAVFTIQRQSIGGLVTSLGVAFDMLGFYFLFRNLIHDFDDATFAVRALCVLAIPIALLMLVEQRSGRNPFFAFGGVPRFTEARGGHLRSQASFAHPILAGTFGATLVPLVAGIWRLEPRSRSLACLGLLAASAIAFFSYSSSPIFALLVGVAGVFMWPVSGHMRELRWFGLLGIVGLQLVMKSPVYALVARVPLVSGSTAYYRFALVDAFFHHFKDWWLLGVPSTWYWGVGLFDVTNEFIRIAVDGGLASLTVFVAVIALEYRDLGRALRTLRNAGLEAEWSFIWCLGATLSGHIVSFLSVSYFDQITVVWYLLLAMIPSLRQAAVLRRLGQKPQIGWPGRMGASSPSRQMS
jgi:hypothetical protein